jgi:malate dehydrogenase
VNKPAGASNIIILSKSLPCYKRLLFIINVLNMDGKAQIPCCAHCDTEYNAGGYFVAVTAILGRNGVEKVIELDLNQKENKQFKKSLAHVKQLAEQVDRLL